MHVEYSVRDGQRFTTDLNLEVVTCPTCRITYAIPASLASSARAYPGGRPNGGWTICCPLGHDWHYTGPNVSEKLAEERRRHEATRDLLKHGELANLCRGTSPEGELPWRCDGWQEGHGRDTEPPAGSSDAGRAVRNEARASEAVRGDGGDSEGGEEALSQSDAAGGPR